MKRLFLPVLLAAALPAADSRIAPAMNAFTADAYKQVAKGDANLILSPFNIATALSMVMAGARGKTAEEIQAVLHQHYDSSYDAALAALLADLEKAGNASDNQLLAANAVWTQKGFPILPGFEKTLAESYHAPLQLADFIRNAEAARAGINRWTSEHTKQKIQSLFAPGSLNSSTRLVLASAIYFYGRWQTPFLTSRTQAAPFHLQTGAAAQADFMNLTARFAYSETDSAQILEMRYAGTGIAFDVLLPKTAAGLPELEKSLKPESLTGWTGAMPSREVQVSMPKFRVETSFSLAKTLAAMGMPTAFDPNNADFSGITTQEQLYISKVVHQANISVDEKGTEASAATAVQIEMGAIPARQVTLHVDRPFIFAVRDTNTGAILFLGRVVDPSA